MKEQFPCPQWSTKLALRREDFSPSEWEIFETHLRQCPVCAARRAEYGVLVTELQMLSPPIKSPACSFPLPNTMWQDEKTRLLEKAKTLFALQRYEEVLAATRHLFRLPLSDREGTLEGWELKAQAFYMLGRYQEALKACDHALAFGSYAVGIWKMKARSLLILGRYREALKACDDASETNAGDAELWQIKAGVLFFLDREVEQQEREENLFQIDPNYVVDFGSIDMWIDRIHMLCQEERWRYEKALVACDKALQLDPHRKPAWEIKGRTLIALGLFKEALDTLQHCISLDPHDAEEWRFLGSVFNRLGYYKNAQEALKKAEEIDPNREDVWGLRAASLLF